ncbi:hypothetical protein [Agrococcus jejuensis]|uniref:Asp23 family, cell envelope-related function n=1 Tax=Agrococcus jejuensis TaxID=399736 RepID=A0A1G8DPU3_9MICO|nr:hypothetical protein [Agrococcus jejuensis]SDH59657.1 hypothetical protein SAMN04489720_1729 [Agrococcus jejuensis]
MTDPTQVARLVDVAVATVGGVADVYVAAPAIAQVVEAGRRDVLAHVTPFPQAIRVAIGVHESADVRAVTRAAAAAVRAVLPDDWSDARLTVQVRRIERD